MACRSQQRSIAWLHQSSALGRRKVAKTLMRIASPSSRGLGHHPFTVATGVECGDATHHEQRGPGDDNRVFCSPPTGIQVVALRFPRPRGRG